MACSCLFMLWRSFRLRRFLAVFFSISCVVCLPTRGYISCSFEPTGLVCVCFVVVVYPPVAWLPGCFCVCVSLIPFCFSAALVV